MSRHRTDAVSLIFGVLFLFVVAAWAVGGSIDLGVHAFGWLLAGALIVLGVLGLLGALRANRSGAAQDADDDFRQNEAHQDEAHQDEAHQDETN